MQKNVNSHCILHAINNSRGYIIISHFHYFQSISNAQSTERHLACPANVLIVELLYGCVDHAFLCASAPPAYITAHMATRYSNYKQASPRRRAESSAEKQPPDRGSTSTSQLPIVMEMFEPACSNCRKKYRLPGSGKCS